MHIVCKVNAYNAMKITIQFVLWACTRIVSLYEKHLILAKANKHNNNNNNINNNNNSNNNNSNNQQQQ